jgi:hypothetical protein
MERGNFCKSGNDYMPYDMIAREMEINNSPLLKLIMEPKNFGMEEIYRLSEILNYDPVKMANMITSIVDGEWDDTPSRL